MNASMFGRLCFRIIALASFVAAGCQALAGIEERHYQPLVEAGSGREAGAGREGGPTVEVSPACKTYCKHVMDACMGEDQVYTTIEVCDGVCTKLEARGLVGHFDEPGGNTVACRDKQAQNAAFGETKMFCPNAGPGGGDACGPDCESYCMLYADTCADVFPPLENCLSACAVLKRSPPFNSVSDYSGDSLDCRLVHVSVATTDHEMHCPHARIAPPTGPCADDSNKPPTCEDYCRMTLGACGVGGTDGGAEHAQYDSPQECMDVCRALTPGKNNEQSGNTVGCRLYHSYNVLGISVAHCPHTGPTGDGHCAVTATADDRGTDNCDPYCQIVAKACPEEAKAHFGTVKDACHTECAQLSGVGIDSGYSVHTPDGPTVQCRVLHAARAFEDRKECGAALGEVTCK
jgi:hypothetical protein